MSIKVGVRVRPFTKMEQDLKSQLCLQVTGNTIRLYDFDQEYPRTRTRDFIFDNIFWPQSQAFLMSQKIQKQSDQKCVFEKIGQDSLDSLINGFDCAVFSYGQTGSGKNYTLFGEQTNQGLVPKFCKQLFHMTNELQLQGNSDVKISAYQIYRGKIQDLLVPFHLWVGDSLLVKEHHQKGYFVQGLSKVKISELQDIYVALNRAKINQNILLNERGQLRSTTQTIVYVELNTKQTLMKITKNRVSSISFVNLGGSEGIIIPQGRDRLRQASLNGRNQHLYTLKNLILGLADRSRGRKAVPCYRDFCYGDSCITEILRHAFGGNCKTWMIFTISPSYSDYEDTLSTLRYADQSKMIRNTPQIRLIKMLKEKAV